MVLATGRDILHKYNIYILFMICTRNYTYFIYWNNLFSIPK